MTIAAPLALPLFATTGCVERNPSGLATQVYENYPSVPTQQTMPEYSNTRPNLPMISKDFIQYRNLSGEIINVEVNDNTTISLYKAIQQHSNINSPDITDIGSFYADVESNIIKNPEHRTPRGQLSTMHCSILLNKLIELFTSPKSEKGDTITVNEYTKMMDAWRSTGRE